MKFFSKDEYINTKLSMSSFKRIKEKKLKVALQNLSDFGFVPDVEVFNADDEKVYVKDNVGTIYEFTLDFFNYDDSKKREDFYLITVKNKMCFIAMIIVVLI